MKKSGFFWHVHHDVLVEWSDNINERIEYIKNVKPKNEVKTRLKLLQPVKGELPEEVIGAWNAFEKAKNTFNKAKDAYEKVWDTFNKTKDAYEKVWNAYDEAFEARYKTWDAYDEAIVDHLPEIELLHKQECKNCFWDGHTIFPRRKEEEK
jgi:hypothetical protein